MPLYLPQIDEKTSRYWLRNCFIMFDKMRLDIIFKRGEEVYGLWLNLFFFYGVELEKTGEISEECANRTSKTCFVLTSMVEQQLRNAGQKKLCPFSDEWVAGERAEMSRDRLGYMQREALFAAVLENENVELYKFIKSRAELEKNNADGAFHLDHSLFIARILNNALESRSLEEQLKL